MMRNFKTRFGFLITACLLALPLVHNPAYAQCSSPTGVEGEIIFGDDENVPAYCNNTEWIAMVGGDDGSPTGCPNIGDTCNDGSVYAGISPDGNITMYATPADAASTMPWNNGNATDRVETSVTDLTTGAANTAALITIDSDSSTAGTQPHQAAQYCADLDAHSNTDWYLPAPDEMQILYDNRAAIGGFGGSNAYWTSRENGQNGATLFVFSTGLLGDNVKDNNRYVRCVRKVNTQTTEIAPSGLIGHWRLDETSGTTAVNSANPGTHDGTYNVIDPSTDSVAGVVENAISFISPNDEYVQIPDDTDFDLTSYTLSAWVKGDNSSDESDIEKVISKDFNFILNWDHNVQGGASCEHYNGSAWQTTGDAPNLAANTWYHLACTYDSVSDDYIFYVNGVETNRSTSIPGAQLDSQGVLIGRWQPGNGTQNISGDIDDVRIYNRALEPDEIAEIYQAKDGIRYNESQKTMEFFDGNRFVSMTGAWVEPSPDGDGGPSYQANGVNFDGSTHLSDTTISGGDPTLITGSFWVRRDTGNLGVSQTILVYREASAGYFRLRFNSSNEFNIDGQQAGGGTFNILTASTTSITDDNWHHIAFSIDSSNRTLDQVYIDDVDVTDARSATYSAFGGGEQYFVASFNAGGSAEVYGDLADFWIDFDTKLDLSVEANRRLFRDSTGNAVDLGSDGSIPTGSQPELFFSGDASSWHTNKGSLGGATETGTITEASADPGVPPSNGLVGHWKLDEATGSATARDEITGNDHVVRRSAVETNTVASAKGTIGTAYDINNDITIDATNDAQYALDQSWSISAWAKSPDLAEDRFIMMRGTSPNRNYTLLLTSAGTVRVGYDNGSVFAGRETTASFDDDQWHHFVGMFDDATNSLSIYVDGVLVPQSNTGAGVGSEPSTLVGSVLRVLANAGSVSFTGKVDDVRLYDRVLTEEEISQLYQIGSTIGDSTALPVGCPNIGDVCDDGTVYAGISPDGSVAMFATPADADVERWNDGNTNYSVTNAQSMTDGDGNTATIVTTDSDSVTSGFQIHNVPRYCYDLVAHGADDWYLPAQDELAVLESAKNTGAFAGTFIMVPSGLAQNYWSSTERDTDTTRARTVSFENGSTGNSAVKESDNQSARCVRKGPAPRCANPYGLEGQMVYNTSEDVVQYCDGARWVAIGEYAAPPPDTTNPTWVTASGTVATINTSSALSTTVTATDDNGVTYSKVSGDAWISVNSSTGELTGTAPGTTGTYSITVRASDPSSNTADRSFDVVVTAASPPSIALTDSANINSGATSHTHSSMNFGAAATDRIIAVATSYRRTGANTTTPITSMTIGGVAATQAIYTAASQRLQATIWYANVPTGTSGDVVINAAENISSSISVYRMVDLTSSTPTATNGTGATAITTTLGTTLTIQDDGVGICTAGNANDTATISWSGTQISVDTNIQNASSRDNHHSAANITNTSGSSASRTYTSSWSGNEWSAQSCAAWR